MNKHKLEIFYLYLVNVIKILYHLYTNFSLSRLMACALFSSVIILDLISFDNVFNFLYNFMILFIASFKSKWEIQILLTVLKKVLFQLFLTCSPLKSLQEQTFIKKSKLFSTP